jgi:hypothetical protein
MWVKPQRIAIWLTNSPGWPWRKPLGDEVGPAMTVAHAEF